MEEPRRWRGQILEFLCALIINEGVVVLFFLTIRRKGKRYVQIPCFCNNVCTLMNTSELETLEKLRQQICKIDNTYHSKALTNAYDAISERINTLKEDKGGALSM